MSFSNPNVKISYDGNGADDRFGINFYYLEGSESVIQAELWDYSDPDNPSQQSFVDGVDYTIDSSSYPNTEVVTTAPVPVDFKIFIYRSSPQVQSTNFVQGAFPAESVEESLDKLMMVAQEQQEELDRALKNSIGGTQIDNQDLLDAIALEPRVAQNETDISTNASDIGVNAGSIAINAGAIAGNTADIATNAGNIATNAGDIATLQGQVASLTPDTIVSINAGATHAAANGEIVIINTSDPVTVNLPTPTAAHVVKVKISSDTTSKVINSAAGIDGFGANYTVSSSYESLTLVADGTQWFII